MCFFHNNRWIIERRNKNGCKMSMVGLWKAVYGFGLMVLDCICYGKMGYIPGSLIWWWTRFN